MWAQGIEMVTQNPLFGIGKGNFARYTGRLIAHNSAIEVMGETGIPGFFFWLGIIYMAYKSIFAAYRETEDPRQRSYVMALGLSIAGYLLSSLFVTLEYETYYFLLALAGAVGTGLARPPAFKSRDFAYLCGIMAALFVILKAGVMAYY
jgi:O-antigen ligase